MTDYPPASFLRRFGAFLYDLLPVAALLMGVTLALVIIRDGEAVPAGNVLFQLLLFAVAAAFFAGFWWRGGQTLGMQAWRLRVETLSGQPLTAGAALLRFVAALILLAPFGLGFLWMLVDRDKRTLHDRVAGTRVVVLPKDQQHPKSGTVI